MEGTAYTHELDQSLAGYIINSKMYLLSIKLK